MDDIILDENFGAALVGIDARAMRHGRIVIDVMDVVAALGGAGRDPESVDAAHVAKAIAVAEVMDMIVIERVVVGGTRLEAPRPAARDARIIEIGDLVVRDRIRGAGAYPDPVRAVI